MARMRGILRPWTQQPQEVVGIDWGHPSTRGLLIALLPHVRFNLVDGLPLEERSGTVIGPGLRGICVQEGALMMPNPSGSSDPLARFDLSSGTAMVMAVQPVETNNGCSFLRGNGSSTATWSVGLHGGSFDGAYASWGNYIYGGASGGPVSTVPRVSTITADGSNARVFIDGVLQSSGSYTPATSQYAAPGDLRRVVFGSINPTGSDINTMPFFGLLWNRPLPDAEVLELSRNPWQIFEPRRIWVPVGVGGATDYPVTRAESVTATDAAGVVIGYVKIGAESASASDAQDRAIGYAAAAAENTLTLHYEIAALGSTHEVKEEGQTATDAVSSTRAMTKHVGELATATNAQSIVAALSGTLAESASASDAVNASASGDYTGTLAESGAASDAQSVQAALSASLAEAGSAADAASVVRAIAALLTEAASAADAISASAAGNYSASASEIVAAADTVSQIAAMYASVAELTGAIDTVSAGGQLAGVVAEAMAALESITAATGNVALGSLAGSLRQAVLGRPVASGGPSRTAGTMIRR